MSCRSLTRRATKSGRRLFPCHSPVTHYELPVRSEARAEGGRAFAKERKMKKKIAKTKAETETKTLPSDRVTHLPGLGKVDGVQFAGYAAVRGESGADPAAVEKLFYWFVGTEDYARRPTILWTNGGPGSSSFWGFFLENGPYLIDSKGARLSKRPAAWNNYANYMIFEHPLSV